MRASSRGFGVLASMGAKSEQPKLAPTTKARIQKTEGKKGRPKYVIDRDTLSQVFHLPFEKACEQLGIGSTTLKRICREQQIGRWPYRRLMCQDNNGKKKSNRKVDKKKAPRKKPRQVQGVGRARSSDGQGGSVGPPVLSQVNEVLRKLNESNDPAGPKPPIKRNRSFLIYSKDTVWHTEPVNLPPILPLEKDSVRFMEEIPMPSFLSEDFLKDKIGIDPVECDVGKKKGGVKKSRSFLLQISGENNSMAVSPMMDYDFSNDSFENSDFLLKIFEGSASLQSVLQNNQSQSTEALTGKKREQGQNGSSSAAEKGAAEKGKEKDKGDQKPGSVSNSSSSCQTGSAAKGNDNNNKTENPLKRHVNVEELKKFFD